MSTPCLDERQVPLHGDECATCAAMKKVQEREKAPIPEALHYEVRAERDRIYAIFEGRCRRLIKNHWPYVEATETTQVLARLAEEIDPSWKAKLVAACVEEIAKVEGRRS